MHHDSHTAPLPAKAAGHIPEGMRLLRLPDVLETVGLGRTAWFNLVRSGVAPRPVRIGRAVAWPSSDVQAFIRERIAASRGGAR